MFVQYAYRTVSQGILLNHLHKLKLRIMFTNVLWDYTIARLLYLIQAFFQNLFMISYL